MTGTDNMNLHHLQYNLYGRMKYAQESRVIANNINHGVVHINASYPTDFKISEEEKMSHVLGVVLIKKIFPKQVSNALTKM